MRRRIIQISLKTTSAVQTAETDAVSNWIQTEAKGREINFIKRTSNKQTDYYAKTVPVALEGA